MKLKVGFGAICLLLVAVYGCITQPQSKQEEVQIAGSARCWTEGQISDLIIFAETNYSVQQVPDNEIWIVHQGGQRQFKFKETEEACFKQIETGGEYLPSWMNPSAICSLTVKQVYLQITSSFNAETPPAIAGDGIHFNWKESEVDVWVDRVGWTFPSWKTYGFSATYRSDENGCITLVQ